MNEPLELESRPARQQNYQFAYHLVPQFLFRSDFASTIPMAHPRGFEYWEKMWAKMAVAYPAEHLVQADGISSQAYHISKNTYALLVALPAADYSMEVSHLIIVFRPDIEYFVLGNGVDSNSPSTLRRVDTSTNARCGGVFKLSDSEILEAVCSSLGLEPDIRLADDDEFRDSPLSRRYQVARCLPKNCRSMTFGR